MNVTERKRNTVCTDHVEGLIIHTHPIVIYQAGGANTEVQAQISGNCWQTYKEFISVNWKHSIKHVWPLGAQKESISHAYFHCRRREHAQIVISLLGARLVNHTSKASRSCVGYLHKAISTNRPPILPHLLIYWEEQFLLIFLFYFIFIFLTFGIT